MPSLVSLRLWLALVLGIGAGVGNYLVLKSATATVTLIALNTEVKPGEELNRSHFRPVEVKGDSLLFANVIPFHQAAELYGKKPRRYLAKGELLFRADLEHEPFQIHRDLLQPGQKTLTLLIKRQTLPIQPIPGERIEFHIRPGSSGSEAQLAGPFTYLGHIADADSRGAPGDRLRLVIAVSTDPTDPQVEEMTGFQKLGTPDWVQAVEIVRDASRK